NDQVLLVRERRDGLWTLPGGWADVGESPKQCVEKEILEESGYVAKAVRLAAVKDRALHPYTPRFVQHVYKMFFLCELIGGASRTSIETSEVAFFSRDDLPPLSEDRVLAADINMLYAFRNEPDRQAYFD
ncbi:MAG: NUDIX domain-containing protein, partial [Burkholderiaceae bacterium]